MVFILYKLYVLLPYTYPTPKFSPHRRRCIYIFPQKTHSVWFISVLNYGDTENVLINHLLLVIPMSYPCHYTNLCPHKPHKHAHTHTHTHTHKEFDLKTGASSAEVQKNDGHTNLLCWPSNCKFDHHNFVLKVSLWTVLNNRAVKLAEKLN